MTTQVHGDRDWAPGSWHASFTPTPLQELRSESAYEFFLSVFISDLPLVLPVEGKKEEMPQKQYLCRSRQGDSQAKIQQQIL